MGGEWGAGREGWEEDGMVVLCEGRRVRERERERKKRKKEKKGKRECL